MYMPVPYTKTVWVDNVTPPGIDQTQLNKIEAGIFDGQTKVVVNTQTGTAYTLALADAGNIVEMNNAATNTVTIPPNSSAAFAVGTIIEVCQIGAGSTSIVAGAGVTIRPTSPQPIAGQWQSLRLRKRATDEWVSE